MRLLKNHCRSLCLSSVGLLIAWTTRGQEPYNRVYLDSATFTYAFYTTQDQPKIKTGRSYTWYKAGRILTTVEGYDGLLLDGEYRMFYLNKSLYRQGNYKMGIRSGLWREWYANGQLKEKSVWEEGRLRGEPERFDSTGRPAAVRDTNIAKP